MSPVGHGWRQEQKNHLKDHLRVLSAKCSVPPGSEGGMVNIYVQEALTLGLQVEETVLQGPITLHNNNNNNKIKVDHFPLTRPMQSAGQSSYILVTARAVMFFFFFHQFIPPMFIEHLLNVSLCERHRGNTDEDRIVMYSHLTGEDTCMSRITCQVQ